MSPSRHFLEGAVQHRMLVAYTRMAADGQRTGIVMVGPADLAPDLATLQNDGIVSQVVRDGDASLVWRSEAWYSSDETHPS